MRKKEAWMSLTITTHTCVCECNSRAIYFQPLSLPHLGEHRLELFSCFQRLPFDPPSLAWRLKPLKRTQGLLNRLGIIEKNLTNSTQVSGGNVPFSWWSSLFFFLFCHSRHLGMIGWYEPALTANLLTLTRVWLTHRGTQPCYYSLPDTRRHGSLTAQAGIMSPTSRAIMVHFPQAL